MIIYVVIFLAGLGVLYLGADWLVKGSARLARILHITPLAIGLTVVSFGTSAPELVVSVVAAVKKEADIALGNVIGSNIANIGLILGVSAVITALKCNVKTVKREVPIMIGVSFLLLLLSLDGKITFLDGLILFSGIIAFTLYNYLSARKEALEISPDVEEKYVNLLSSPQLKLSRSLTLTLGGLFLLLISASLIVDSAVVIAERLGISNKIIALSMVAVGTSLPELATSSVAAFRGESDISIGNVIGSCIFNILSVIGLVSMLDPIDVGQGFIWDFLVMFFFSFLLIPLMVSRHMISRKEGVLLLILYSGYIGWLAFQAF